jgi:hypothetical protein
MLAAIVVLVANLATTASYMGPPIVLHQQPGCVSLRRTHTSPSCVPCVPHVLLRRAEPHRSGSGLAAASAMADGAPLPRDPDALQQRLWEAADVLPSLQHTPLRLAKTQDTGVSDLGFVASTAISKGDVLISVPMRYALVVNMKSGAKGSEQPSDMRLALELLRVLDLTNSVDAEFFDDDVKEFWRAYTLRILPRETFAAIAWEEPDIEQLQFERTVEEVKALRSRLEELCKQTLEEEEEQEEQEQEENDDDDDDDEHVPVPRKRKVTISKMQAVRLPGGKTMMEDATLRWALSIVRSRSFMLDDNEDSPVVRRAIVPVADLFNHQPEGPLTWAAMDEELTNPWSVVRGDDGQLYVDISAHRCLSVSAPPQLSVSGPRKYARVGASLPFFWETGGGHLRTRCHVYVCIYICVDI